jgi:hypothetical protein
MSALSLNTEIEIFQFPELYPLSKSAGLCQEACSLLKTIISLSTDLVHFCSSRSVIYLYEMRELCYSSEYFQNLLYVPVQCAIPCIDISSNLSILNACSS